MHAKRKLEPSPRQRLPVASRALLWRVTSALLLLLLAFIYWLVVAPVAVLAFAGASRARGRTGSSHMV